MLAGTPLLKTQTLHSPRHLFGLRVLLGVTVSFLIISPLSPPYCAKMAHISLHTKPASRLSLCPATPFFRLLNMQESGSQWQRPRQKYRRHTGSPCERTAQVPFPHIQVHISLDSSRILLLVGCCTTHASIKPNPPRMAPGRAKVTAGVSPHVSTHSPTAHHRHAPHHHRHGLPRGMQKSGKHYKGFSVTRQQQEEGERERKLGRQQKGRARARERR